jgi:hypothetical protein
VFRKVLVAFRNLQIPFKVFRKVCKVCNLCSKVCSNVLVEVLVKVLVELALPLEMSNFRGLVFFMETKQS